jgi:hypothetical protein
MKLESDELAKNMLLGRVNCEYCQNHLRCEFDDNTWWCTMSKEEPVQICEQWEPPNIDRLPWSTDGYDKEKNARTALKIHAIRRKLGEFNARR